MNVIATERLALRHLDTGDADFILRLLNEPSWLQYIGDKGIRTLADAERYIAKGPAAMYERMGFGLYHVALRESDEAIGLCGLIKRDALDDVDLGFALLPAYWGKRYAFEAAAATLAYGRSVLGLARIVAIVSPDNRASTRLLERLGFRFERMVRLSPEDHDLELYAAAADAGGQGTAPVLTARIA